MAQQSQKGDTELTRSLFDLPPLDLRESMTPFTSQYEAGEWDWQDSGPSWFEVEGSPDPDDTRKDR